MSVLVWLVPMALAMGGVALLAFLWSLRSGQYEDMSGSAERVLLAQAEDRPLPDGGPSAGSRTGKTKWRSGSEE